MKNKNKIALSLLALLITSFFLLAILTTTAKIGVAYYLSFIRFMKDPVGVEAAHAQVNIPKLNEKLYKYNDQIPVETVKAEIRKQAKEFGNDEKFMIKLADCESDFNNLAENKKSSAEGVYQFIYGTWRPTASGKGHISRFDYKANIREANIKIANGEYSHWEECLK